MTGRQLAVVFALVAVTAPTAARADDAGIAVGGTAKRWDRPPVVAAVEVAAQEAGWTTPTTLTADDSNAVLKCPIEPKPWVCVTSSNLRRLERMLVIAVADEKGKDGAPAIRVTARIANGSQLPVVESRLCERCTNDALVKTALDLAKQVLRTSAVQSGRTLIAVTSVPTGAQIKFDGEPVGTTDAKVPTFPGAHVIEIAKPGFATERRDVTAVQDETVEVAIEMRAEGGGGSRLVPALVIGAGVAAIATGGVLFAIDEDTAPRDDPKINDTAPIGIGIGAAGVVAAGVGAYLWVRAGKRETAPSVAVTGGGAVVGWGGRF